MSTEKDSGLKLSDLVKLHQVFKKDSALSEKQFVHHFASILGGQHWTPTQISQLFMKIDANSDGTVDWDEFTNFMFLNSTTKEPITTTFVPRSNYAQDQAARCIHRTKDVCVGLVILPRNGHYLACTHGGIISTYVPTNLTAPISSFKTAIAKSKCDWVFSIAYLQQSAKVVVASLENGIGFYDHTTNEKKLVSKLALSDLKHSTPLCMSTMIDENTQKESLFIGDDVGAISQITFDDSLSWHICDGQLGCHAKPTIKLCRIQRAERHNDYISQLEYIADLNCIVSASHDGSIKVVDMTRGILKRDFREHKGAVYSFAWCKEPKLIASCGLERQILLWSPYSVRLVGQLSDNIGSIRQVLWNSPSCSLLSLGLDGIVRVWDVKNYKCTQVIDDASHEQHKVHSIAYDDRSKQLITISSTISEWPMHSLLGATETFQQHEHPICKALYNPSFQQVVSIDTNAHVVLWDLLDGSMISNFAISHTTITAAALDASGRRLITGSYAGDSIKLWNFSNGSLLMTLKKDKESDKSLEKDVRKTQRMKSNEITCVLPLTASVPYSSGRGFVQTKYVACTGWDRRVYLWNDGNNSEYLRRMPEQVDSGKFHTGDVLAFAFCPPKCIATGGVDGCVILWSFNSGDMMHKFNFNSGIEALMYPLKLGLLIGVTTNSTLVLINPRQMLVYAIVALYDNNALPSIDVRVAKCDADGELVFTGLSSGTVQIFRLGAPDRLPFEVQRLNEWSAHTAPIASLDYVEVTGILETFLLTSSSEEIPTIKLWTLGGVLVGSFGQDNWSLGSFQVSSYDSKSTHFCSLNMGPSKGVEMYKRERRGLLLSSPPLVGDVWYRKDELGVIGAVITLTSVSRNKGNVEGFDGRHELTEMELTTLFDHSWHRHEFLTFLVGRIFQEDEKSSPFKIEYATYNGSWQIVDTSGKTHPLPNEKDPDPNVFRTYKSIALYKMYPLKARPVFYTTTPPELVKEPTVILQVPLPPKPPNPFLTSAAVQSAVGHFKRHRLAHNYISKSPTQLTMECNAVKLRLPTVQISPRLPERKHKQTEYYVRLDSRHVVALEDTSFNDLPVFGYKINEIKKVFGWL
ncbi:hypothetical protein THRCLA_09365 [Thraustotheca clavata]|uniref:EF-hand domain-containing protein n=1 Tax=Thraustotheca clavata TaxID=74557 RepID=A0A1V9YXC5_9STRA|nr:hypothetical protein THRCLA_09365 [Thraustotheca clavata]